VRRTAARERFDLVFEELPLRLEIVERRRLHRTILNEHVEQPLLELVQVGGGHEPIGRKLRRQDAVHGRLAGVERFPVGTERADESSGGRRGDAECIGDARFVELHDGAGHRGGADAPENRSGMPAAPLEAAPHTRHPAAAQLPHHVESRNERGERFLLARALLLRQRERCRPAGAARMTCAAGMRVVVIHRVRHRGIDERSERGRRASAHVDPRLA
jgi:hypothetical protein